ncbi:Hypothetical protein OINT_1002086 [Brucella intermedia LMG 3301]|uniref:Uncharacterized protein n=1 Tax=Brucella intermedia LMG 3301 TaxID=641118 RepID=C4WHW8_9HYPH|nr:Hypothetical protein OINT_1002086 [Brucella intermedia LMG 3301]
MFAQEPTSLIREAESSGYEKMKAEMLQRAAFMRRADSKSE